MTLIRKARIMKPLLAFAPVLTLLLAAPPALAAGNAQPRAAIAFANHDGVRDWVAVGDQTIYFQDNFRHWYKATLFAPSTELPFAQAIGLDTGPMGSLDKWSNVIIRGQRYPISAFVPVDGPPVKTTKHKN
jgi:hypothetical protein